MSDERENGLIVEGLYTAYDKANVLEDVSLRVETAKITCLLGSNGSGKTTLIRSILGLTPPNRGRIPFGGAEPTGLPTHRTLATRLPVTPHGRPACPTSRALARRRAASSRRFSMNIRRRQFATTTRRGGSPWRGSGKLLPNRASNTNFVA